MNGFMLLVLVVMAGQVSPGGLTMPPSLNPVQPASMITTPPPQTDYGWQIAKDGVFEYIVQISPEKAEFMYKNSKETLSTIPPVVAARVKRIVVRFGSEPIESTPIEQVLQLPRVDAGEIASNLPTGRIKTLENSDAYDLQNVGGGIQPPPLASGGMGTSLADATASLNDKMTDALNDPSSLLAQRGAPGSNFIQDAMGNPAGAAAAPGFPAAPTGSPYAMPGTNSDMPRSTATTPPPAVGGFNTAATTGNGLNPTGAGTTGANTVGAPGMGTAGLGANGMGTAGLGGNTTIYGQQPSAIPGGNFTSIPGQSNASLGQNRGGFAAAPLGTSQLNGNTPWSAAGTGGYNNTPGVNNGQYANTPGYTGSPGYNNTPGANQSYPNNQGYAQSPSNQFPYTNNQTGGYLPSDPLSIRLADSRNAIPGTSTSGTIPSTSTTGTNLNSSRSNWGGGRTDGYGSDQLTDANGQLNPRGGMENIMPVMFVLSLVVNFYLGMLIRKLLGRYRTLLASVRSQTI